MGLVNIPLDYLSGIGAEMFEELKRKKELYQQLEKELSSPECLSDREQYRIKSKEYADLKEKDHVGVPEDRCRIGGTSEDPAHRV